MNTALLAQSRADDAELPKTRPWKSPRDISLSLRHQGFNTPLRQHPAEVVHDASVRVVLALWTQMVATTLAATWLSDPKGRGPLVCSALLAGLDYSLSAALWAGICVLVLGTLLLWAECCVGYPDMRVRHDQLPALPPDSDESDDERPPRRGLPSCLMGCPPAKAVVCRSACVLLAHLAVSIALECALPTGMVVASLLHQSALLTAWLAVLGLGTCFPRCHCLRRVAYSPKLVMGLMAAVTAALVVFWLLPFGLRWEHAEHAPDADVGLVETAFWRDRVLFLTPPHPIAYAYLSLLVGFLALVACVRAWQARILAEPLHSLDGALFAAANLQMVLFGWSTLAWLTRLCSCDKRRQGRIFSR